MHLELTTTRFGVGTHAATSAPTGNRDLCIMEAVAYMAGEPWSDAPACASPVIAAFVRTWQDDLDDADRDRLLPAAVWVPRLVGSLGNDAVEVRRAFMALDWLVRVHAPAWLDLTPSLRPHAAALRALSEVIDVDAAGQARPVVYAARAAASVAARDAAGDSLRPTVEALQASALDLLDRMLACGEHRREEEAHLRDRAGVSTL